MEGSPPNKKRNQMPAPQLQDRGTAAMCQHSTSLLVTLRAFKYQSALGEGNRIPAGLQHPYSRCYTPKMSKLLVADHQRSVRKALKETLADWGYDVIDAANGQAALDLALHENFDGIMLDVDMPVMDGWQVLAKLKADSKTKSIPVIMLVAIPSVEIEATGIRLGAAHFISKPWHPESLAITVRVALREAQNTAESEQPDLTPQPESSLIQVPSSDRKKIIDTGSKLIPFDKVLGGGIPIETLTLIGGSSSGAESVLCQYLTYGAILDGRTVAYFTGEHTADSLFKQMGSIGLDVSDYVQEDSVAVHRLQRPSADDDPEKLLAALASDIEHIPASRGIIVVDSLSGLAEISEARATLRFFSSCNRLSTEGRTIIVTARSSAFDDSTHSRVHGICDNHIRVGTERVRDRMLNTLEVLKVNKAEFHSDNGFSFEIEPGVGITIVPMSRVKV